MRWGVQEGLMGGLVVTGKCNRYNFSTVDLSLKVEALERAHQLKSSFFVNL